MWVSRAGYGTFPNITLRDRKNTIRLKISIITDKIDIDYLNLINENQDISGHFRALQPTTCDPENE
jgi:hypothetical protein